MALANGFGFDIDIYGQARKILCGTIVDEYNLEISKRLRSCALDCLLEPASPISADD